MEGIGKVGAADDMLRSSHHVHLTDVCSFPEKDVDNPAAFQNSPAEYFSVIQHQSSMLPYQHEPGKKQGEGSSFSTVGPRW